jgi:hypothetical protein
MVRGLGVFMHGTSNCYTLHSCALTYYTKVGVSMEEVDKLLQSHKWVGPTLSKMFLVSTHFFKPELRLLNGGCEVGVGAQEAFKIIFPGIQRAKDYSALADRRYCIRGSTIHHTHHALYSPCTMHHAPCTMHRAPCTVHHAPYTMHHAPCTMHRTPCTMHHAPCTMHHAPYTVHRAPYTMHHAPCTMHHTPYTIHHTPYTKHHTLYSPCTI